MAIGCYVEVFEVTGPSVYIMLFSKSIESHAIDANPKWSLKVFLYYVKLFASTNEIFVSIDYVSGNLKKKSVRDLLNVMGFLCPCHNKTACPSKRNLTSFCFWGSGETEICIACIFGAKNVRCCDFFELHCEALSSPC